MTSVRPPAPAPAPSETAAPSISRQPQARGASRRLPSPPEHRDPAGPGRNDSGRRASGAAECSAAPLGAPPRLPVGFAAAGWALNSGNTTPPSLLCDLEQVLSPL